MFTNEEGGKEPWQCPSPRTRRPTRSDSKAARNTAWCACGRSANQPFCDGTHAGTGISPKVFAAQETREVWLCGCKHTADKPFCDGTHGTL